MKNSILLPLAWLWLCSIKSLPAACLPLKMWQQTWQSRSFIEYSLGDRSSSMWNTLAISDRHFGSSNEPRVARVQPLRLTSRADNDEIFFRVGVAESFHFQKTQFFPCCLPCKRLKSTETAASERVFFSPHIAAMITNLKYKLKDFSHLKHLSRVEKRARDGGSNEEREKLCRDAN